MSAALVGPCVSLRFICLLPDVYKWWQLIKMKMMQSDEKIRKNTITKIGSNDKNFVAEHMEHAFD